jgi:TonB family protein
MPRVPDWPGSERRTEVQARDCARFKDIGLLGGSQRRSLVMRDGSFGSLGPRISGSMALAWKIPVWALVALLSAGIGRGQAPIPDREMETAESLVGKGLFLRGFYLNNDLSYDSTGRVQGAPKMGDWTVAAINVLKAERRAAAGEIELDGVRAAMRYNPDSRDFQRHPLNDEKIRLVVKDPGDVKLLEAAFSVIFSVGIDPALQRAMPDYWRHYFDPSLAWPEDDLKGQTVYALYGAGDQGKEVTAPRVEHDVEAKYPPFAVRDKVQGVVQLRVVVDGNGAPQRVAVSRPLGYGLDASAAEAMKKWRFAPGMKAGAAVATGVLLEQQFTLINPPR